MSRRAAAFVLAALAGCGRPPAPADEDAAPATAYDDRYPDRISAPPGTSYPCAVTALPKSLDGIPPSHRGAINHAYALIIEAVHERLKVHAALWRNDRGALESYLGSTRAIERKFREEPAPRSLEPFKEDVLAALKLQMEFYQGAFGRRAQGATAEAACSGTPQGREGSGRLQAAWGKMQARYPKWSPAVKDAIFHHLCALDVY